MIEIDRIALLPSGPAVYALYSRTTSVAYVGISGHLRHRIEQHLESNSSSVTNRDSAVILNTDQIQQVRWWTDPEFRDGVALGAAEEIAFEVFQPILRSQGKTKQRSRTLAEDEEFRNKIRTLLESPPTGQLVFPTLQDALDRISLLERQIAALESANQSGSEAPAGSASLSGI